MPFPTPTPRPSPTPRPLYPVRQPESGFGAAVRRVPLPYGLNLIPQIMHSIREGQRNAAETHMNNVGGRPGQPSSHGPQYGANAHGWRASPTPSPTQAPYYPHTTSWDDASSPSNPSATPNRPTGDPNGPLIPQSLRDWWNREGANSEPWWPDTGEPEPGYHPGDYADPYSLPNQEYEDDNDPGSPGGRDRGNQEPGPYFPPTTTWNEEPSGGHWDFAQGRFMPGAYRDPRGNNLFDSHAANSFLMGNVAQFDNTNMAGGHMSNHTSDEGNTYQNSVAGHAPLGQNSGAPSPTTNPAEFEAYMAFVQAHPELFG